MFDFVFVMKLISDFCQMTLKVLNNVAYDDEDFYYINILSPDRMDNNNYNNNIRKFKKTCHVQKWIILILDWEFSVFKNFNVTILMLKNSKKASLVSSTL